MVVAWSITSSRKKKNVRGLSSINWDQRDAGMRDRRQAVYKTRGFVSGSILQVGDLIKRYVLVDKAVGGAVFVCRNSRGWRKESEIL